MNSESRSPVSAAVQRLTSVADAGAEAAAKALAELVGCAVSHRQPGDRSDGFARRTNDRSTGIFFEVSGELCGGVALLFGPRSHDRVVRRLLGHGGDGDLDPDPDAAFSAVCELGNIVASRTVSAVADTLGARILLSPPNFATGWAECALESWVSERRRLGPVLRFESELADIEGSFEALLVFVVAS